MSLKKPLSEKVLKSSLLFLVISVFALISLGGLVRNAGAGLSCPDWPLCFGRVVPPMNVQVFLEWFHRLIAGSISIFLLGVSGFIFFVPALRKPFAKYCIIALLLLTAQIVLGGLTVIGLLSPKWVVSHLAVGILFFMTLFKLYLDYTTKTETKGIQKNKSSIATLAFVTLVTVYGQVVLGGLVSSNFAGLACPDFPTCFGQWFPEFAGLVKFQVLHRLGALVSTILVSVLFVQLYRDSGKKSFSLNSAFWLLPVVLLLQVALGIGSVLFQLLLPVSVAHLATAVILLSTLMVVHHELSYR